MQDAHRLNPSATTTDHSWSYSHDTGNEYNINFTQMEHMADDLLRQEFPETVSQLPPTLSSAPPLRSPDTTQPSNATKKVALDAFLPKSLLLATPKPTQTMECPSVEALMDESAVNLRITAKKRSKKAMSEADRNHFIALQAQWEKVLAINAIRRSVSMDMVESIL